MTAAPMHDVKSAAAVLADDVICQSFIQSSSTLAYACLLIRREKYELATHVLHSLEAKQASRFKDMVFYLQAQIGIETGEHAAVKRRLVPRAHQHPNDMVALSLLESCIYLEFVEWEKSHPRPQAPHEPASLASTHDDTLAPAEPAAVVPAPALPAAGTSRAPHAPAAAASPDADFGQYQSLANDANTLAIALWNPEKGRFKSHCRNAGLEPLAAALPDELPSPIQSACTALEAGTVNKICFSFQAMTVTTFHAGSENMGLITGHINQSLLSIVRAENTFRKQAASIAQAASAPSGRNGEPAPHE